MPCMALPSIRATWEEGQPCFCVRQRATNRVLSASRISTEMHLSKAMLCRLFDEVSLLRYLSGCTAKLWGAHGSAFAASQGSSTAASAGAPCIWYMTCTQDLQSDVSRVAIGFFNIPESPASATG